MPSETAFVEVVNTGLFVTVNFASSAPARTFGVTVVTAPVLSQTVPSATFAIVASRCTTTFVPASRASAGVVVLSHRAPVAVATPPSFGVRFVRHDGAASVTTTLSAAELPESAAVIV